MQNFKSLITVLAKKTTLNEKQIQYILKKVIQQEVVFQI